MMFLRQSTASQAVLLGPFVDDTDGATAETGLTIANTDIRLSANGGNMASKNSGGGTHDENGWYTITLDATDTATVGRLQVSCKVAGALAVWMEFQVLEENIYDALVGASAAAFDANQRISVGSWLSTAVTLSATTAKPQVDVDSIDDDATAADNAELFFDNTGYNASNSTIGTCTTNTDMRGTDSAALASVCTEARLAELGATNIPADIDALTTAVATIDANVDAILLDTGTSGVVLSTATQQAVADIVLTRAASNIEDTADKHSLGALVMIGTNSSVTDNGDGTGTLTANKPSDDSLFQTYALVISSGIISGVS